MKLTRPFIKFLFYRREQEKKKKKESYKTSILSFCILRSHWVYNKSIACPCVFREQDREAYSSPMFYGSSLLLIKNCFKSSKKSFLYTMLLLKASNCNSFKNVNYFILQSLAFRSSSETNPCRFALQAPEFATLFQPCLLSQGLQQGSKRQA